MYKHMLIDMKNLLYRSLFTGYYDTKFKATGRDYMSIVLTFIASYTNKFRPEQVHIFWDSPRTQVWRRNIVPHYKEHRTELYQGLSINVGAEIDRLVEISADLLRWFGIRQYYRPSMEADDLIYSFCVANKQDKLIIITSDGDFKQIIYNFKHVDLYNPLDKTKELVEVPAFDTAIYKSFIGDKSDNLKGYFRLGKKKAELYVRDIIARMAFFESPKAIIKQDDKLVVVGDQRFRENMSIIDLSLCPHLLDNMMYVSEKLAKPVKFCPKQINETVSKHKLRGITADLARYTAPFITLGVPDGHITHRKSPVNAL